MYTSSSKKVSSENIQTTDGKGARVTEGVFIVYSTASIVSIESGYQIEFNIEGTNNRGSISWTGSHYDSIRRR